MGSYRRSLPLLLLTVTNVISSISLPIIVLKTYMKMRRCKAVARPTGGLGGRCILTCVCACQLRDGPFFCVDDSFTYCSIWLDVGFNAPRKIIVAVIAIRLNIDRDRGYSLRSHSQ